MARMKPIMILCPEHHVSVPGTYECPPGSAPTGQAYDLNRVRCSQHSGRCTQTLCVLHRHSNRGLGTWYPESIIAIPDVRSPSQPAPRPSKPGPGSTVSFEA